jgi:hypothetical protein
MNYKPLFIVPLFIILGIKSVFSLPFEITPSVGVNIAQHYGVDYGYEDYQVAKKTRLGLNAGLSINFPVSELLTYRQEFLYTQKGSRQGITISDEAVSFDIEYSTDYLEFPSLFQFNYYRRSTFSLYTLSGYFMSYLIRGHYTIDGHVNAGNDSWKLDVDEKMKSLDAFDFGLIFGGGLDYRLFNNRFSFEYRINFSIPFIDLPTTEDIYLEEDTPLFEESSRVKLRNQTYTAALRYHF